MNCLVFRLWLPTETDSVTLPLILSSMSSVSTPKSSRYTQTTTHCPPPLLPTNSLKISSQSTQSSFAACKDNVQQKTDSFKSTSSNSSNSKGKRKVGESLKFARKKTKVEGL